MNGQVTWVRSGGMAVVVVASATRAWTIAPNILSKRGASSSDSLVLSCFDWTFFFFFLCFPSLVVSCVRGGDFSKLNSISECCSAEINCRVLAYFDIVSLLCYWERGKLQPLVSVFGNSTCSRNKTAPHSMIRKHSGRDKAILAIHSTAAKAKLWTDAKGRNGGGGGS